MSEMSETPAAEDNAPSAVSDINMADESLYTDFTNYKESDNKKVPQAPQSSNDDDKPKEHTNKRPNRKDWLDTDNPLHCKPCDFTAKDIQEFQDHSLSYKHIKTAAQVLEMKVNTTKDEEKKQAVQFLCQVCECSCNSESAWNSHLLGQKHRKNLEKQGAARKTEKQKLKHGGYAGPSGGPIYNTYHQQRNMPYQKQQQTVGGQCANDFAQYKEPLIGLEYVTEIQVAGQNLRYHCKLCDAKFDHNIKFPHLVGAKHRFNVLKTKNPAAATEIRVGIKKRSELTEKLLEEAIKIEQEEGRKQVKTCVEASPFENLNACGAPSPLMSVGRGQSQPSRINPGKQHVKVTGMKTNPNLKSCNTSFNPSTSNTTPIRGRGRGLSSNRGQPFNGGQSSYRGQPSNKGQLSIRGQLSVRGHQYQDRGRGNSGVRGRGRGRGFNYANNQESFSGGYNQQNPPPNLMEQGSLLPQDAFRPRSPPRSQPSYNYGQPYEHQQEYVNQPYQQPQHQNYPAYNAPHSSQWTPPSNETLHPAPHPQPHSGQSPQSKPAKTAPPPQSPESSKQSLLHNLSDLGKLVNSEEDASIALQVSNALTQALLNYRMQTLE